MGGQWPWPAPAKPPHVGLLRKKEARKAGGKTSGVVGQSTGSGKLAGFPKNIHRGPHVNGCVKKYK